MKLFSNIFRNKRSEQIDGIIQLCDEIIENIEEFRHEIKNEIQNMKTKE